MTTYSCGLIRDLLPLYQDGVASEDSCRAVEDHLAVCATCRQLAKTVDDALLGSAPPSPACKSMADPSDSAIRRGLSRYRLSQAGLTLLLMALFFSLALPWFNYHPGITLIRGTVLLERPLAVPGAFLFLLSLWYEFRSFRIRQILGVAGLGALLFSEALMFLTFPSPSTTGLDFWGILGYTVPSFYGFSLQNCLDFTEPPFYFGWGITWLMLVLLLLLFRRIRRRTAF